MRYFPIFLDVENQPLRVAGGGDAALAKLRLLVKTSGLISVYAVAPLPEIEAFAANGQLILIRRRFQAGDATGAALVYAASDDEGEDARVAAIARAEGALVNLVDNLADSQFLTPAIVDRDPVVVAVGTEGTAPVLARAIKSDVEARLSPSLGTLARIASHFRRAAEALPHGAPRRAFWAACFGASGSRALATGGEAALIPALEALLDQHLTRTPAPGHVTFVGAGPGDPELLTLKARKALDAADVVLHDRLIAPAILELARREALIVDVGKQGFGPGADQATINDLLVRHAAQGHQVVRLKSGDSGIFGRLDEEISALEPHGIGYSVVPGITAAAAAAAAIGQSLTQRGRNASVRFLTGHDVAGLAEQDWKALAQPGEVAAIYMARRAARFLQGRLLMHGAAPDTPVTLVENVSRPDQRIVAATLLTLPDEAARLDGPVVLLYGISPRAAALTLATLKEAQL